MKIRVVGDQVTTWLNGEKMVEFSDEKIGEAKEKFILQIHDGRRIKVYWRNIVIEETRRIKSRNKLITPELK